MNDLQRTPQWHLARRGKMTASECHLLLQRGRGKGDTFSQTCLKWLERKIAEYYMTESSYLEFVELGAAGRAAEWGSTFEDDARMAYCDKTGTEVDDAPFIPLEGREDFAGGSPDGLTDGGIIEIKCPFSPETHLRHCLYGTPEDLKADNPQYYAQCQMNMLCVSGTGRECSWCDFVSYDPRISLSRQLSVLRVPFDGDFCKELEERIALAVDFYRERMAEIDSVPPVR